MKPVPLGRRIRTLREERGLSINEVARRSGVAVSFLSCLERGQSSVSVGKLKTVLDALGSNLGAFFANEDENVDRVVYRRKEQVDISGQNKGLSLKDIGAGRPGRKLQLLYERYAPRSGTGSELYQHQGVEAGIVIRGKVKLQVDEQVFELGVGDAYYFESTRPHRMWNDQGRESVVVSATTPPNF